jgi:hypothetical protein
LKRHIRSGAALNAGQRHPALVVGSGAVPLRHSEVETSLASAQADGTRRGPTSWEGTAFGSVHEVGQRTMVRRCELLWQSIRELIWRSIQSSPAVLAATARPAVARRRQLFRRG